MTVIAAPRRRGDNLARRWLRTGHDHARADAPSHRRSRPATATSHDNLNHLAKLLSPIRRVSNRLKGLSEPSLAPSTSAKSP